LGEPCVQHEVEIGLRRLKDLGLNVRFSSHALMGQKYLSEHPEARAADLLEALHSDTDMILCAIGGDDTYRLLPYLFDHDELKKAACNKIFLGFSDTTMNHFMLHKVGMKTFYGQSFLSDICEIGPDMFSYSRQYFEELLTTGSISKITSSTVWYEVREDFSKEAIGTLTKDHEDRGFELLQGRSEFSGEILGGCIDSIFDIFDNTRYKDTVTLCKKYELFPSLEDWKGKILLLETSEELAPPEKFRNMIRALKKTGIFEVLNGVLVGKPVNELFHNDYKKILVDEIANSDVSIMSNINIGHANPRCIIPFGVMAHVNEQSISFE